MDGDRFDVVIVGAGTAGASAAYQFARRGRRVALVDAKAFDASGARWVNGVAPWMFAPAVARLRLVHAHYRRYPEHDAAPAFDRWARRAARFFGSVPDFELARRTKLGDRAAANQRDTSA